MGTCARCSLALAASVLAAGLGATGQAIVSAQNRPAEATKTIEIKALSTRPDRVSGGDVLVEVIVPAESKSSLVVTLGGRDVSAAFQPSAAPRSFLGLVTGLANGKNLLRVEGRGWGAPDATLDVTNYPMSGPIVSGPPLQPFVCQTDTFKLPDGSTLGPPLDANCSVTTRVQYVYLPTGATAFVPLQSTTALPADVAMTTTTAGVTVPFVVRVETGTADRGIYQNVVLHDPTKDRAPTPFTPPPAWNRRLIALHGTGCISGWYRQGAVMGVDPLAGASLTRLGEGYAIFTNTLNHPTNSCNAFLAGETAMMGKEHVIETFGVPEFTVSMGTSGGAYTSLQIADAFPGLFDGVLYNATFPDALSIAVAGDDAHLLAHYFTVTNPTGFNEAQQVGVSGYAGMKAFLDAANQAQRTDPVPDRADIEGYKSAVWHESVLANLRYDPKTNRRGARPTVFDVARNIYGVDERTGFALRPFDNVGVQYGLAALAAGTITPEQFLDLNARIGGLDQDANYVRLRSAADVGALKRAYQSGVTLGGGGGLASIPVFDDGRYNEAAAYHYQWFHFAVRERMRRQNGNTRNLVMWRGPTQAERAWQVFTAWVAAVVADSIERAATREGGAPQAERCGGRLLDRRGARQAGRIHCRAADVQPPARLSLQFALSVVFVCPARGGRAARRQHPQVPAQADRSQELRVVRPGRPAAAPHDLSDGRLRLLEARCQSDAGRAVGVVRAGSRAFDAGASEEAPCRVRRGEPRP